MQDEFEEQMERDAVAISEQSIPDTSFRSENLNESIEIDNQIPHTDFSEPVKDISTAENINSEAAILATISDYRIRFSPLPPSVLNELKLQRKQAKKAKKHDRREEYKEKRKPDNSKQSTDESPPQPQLKLKKPRLQRLRACATCNNDIFMNSNLIHERSVYCSIACIKNMVLRCRKCCKPNDKITFMDESGTLIQLPNAQIITTMNLEEFLTKEPYVKPFVDFAKLEEDEPKSKVFDSEKGLKKEDAIRAAVKQNIHDQLMKRAKKSKVGVSRKATKELSDQIEIELYRVHKSAKAAKYKSWCADFLFQVTDDNNMFFKNVVTNVYTAKKLVTLTKQEMIINTEESVKFNGTPISSPIKGPTQNRVFAKVKPSPKLSSKPVVSAVDMILGEEGADTTLKHNSHEFDSNCQICLRKVAERKAQMELIEKDREEEIEDRKRRKELGKNRKRENKSPPSRPSRSRWEKTSSRRSLERQSSPRYGGDYDFDDPFSNDQNSPRRDSPRRGSPRDSPRRRNRQGSPPRDFHRSQSFTTTSMPPRHDSPPPHGLIRTPPPGKSFTTFK
uniref:TFIIS central domain-containing protein n=1 Tax=Panagrolaimus superbus TaxID=310955 RepID=A0A914Y088_9BILA